MATNQELIYDGINPEYLAWEASQNEAKGQERARLLTALAEAEGAVIVALDALKAFDSGIDTE